MRCLELAELSPDEKDLLERIKKKPELKPLFFRKVKGFKWFDALNDEGYFNAETIPKPIPSEQKGYWRIPYWEIGEYLVKTAPKLADEEGLNYAPRFMEIISNATTYAKKHDFSNHRVWYQFAQVVSQIPSHFVEEEFLENIVDYWLDDKFEKHLISEDIAKWFLKLLKEEDEHAFRLALGLLDILYKVEPVQREYGQDKMFFRSGNQEIDEITDKVAFLSGLHLGIQAVLMLDSRLKETLKILGNDSWSKIWQPSIAESDKESYFYDPENVLVKAYRECLKGFFKNHPDKACSYVGEMIESPLQTVQRIAIHFTTCQFQTCREYTGKLIDEKFFSENYRNEFWHFLNRCYTHFDPAQKSKTVELIKKREAFDKRDGMLEPSKAYEEAFWLAAIKDYDRQAQCLYEKAISVAGTKPRPPGSSRVGEVKTGWITEESIYPTDELSLLSPKQLAQRLRAGDAELVGALKPLIKASPLNYYPELAEFKDLGFPCQYAITRAYCELWKEKASLPWDDVWTCLLEFFSEIVESEQFKNNASEKSALVSAIAEFLESGAWSDEHAFDERHHAKAEFVINCLLQNEKGLEFKETQDKVTTAINSPRGKCIQALINLTLRSCRLSHQGDRDDHSGAWENFRHYYDSELKKADFGEFEFSTLVTAYLSNFLYMSRQWVLSSLDKIFGKESLDKVSGKEKYMKWLCAMEGYYYSRMPEREIYKYLSRNDHLLKVLSDENIMSQVKGRVIEDAAWAYIDDLETFEDSNSMIKVLIDRGVSEELDILIHVMTNFRKEVYGGVENKIFELWPSLRRCGKQDF